MRKVFNVHAWPFFTLLFIAEATLLLAAMYVGFFLSGVPVDGFADLISKFAGQSLIFATVLILMQFCFGLYDWNYCSKVSQLLPRMTAAFASGFILMAVVFYVFPQTEIWRSSMAVALPAGFAAVLALRLAFSRIPTKDYLKRRLLVIGVDDEAARIESLEIAGKAYRFTCVSFINITGNEPKVSPSKVTLTPNSLSQYVSDMCIDEIVIAVSDRRRKLPLDSLLDCRLTGTPITNYQTFFEREMGRVDIETLYPDWFIFSNGFAGGTFQQLMKRFFDLTVSTTMLALLWPLVLLAAIAIRWESPGPIFFRQERVGFRGQPFVVLKLRTMRIDAEGDGIPRWAKAKDPRVTAVGKFLRKTRIDEIPQLINVLKGDMSLVGPRPERPFFVERLSRSIPYYAERHRVKPGLTGWAQLYFRYGASDDDARKKLEYDLYYLKYYSLIRDALIIFQTIRIVIWPQGAR